MQAALGTTAIRVACSPIVTSFAMLAAATRLLLVLVGFGYFYARLQTDPVPRRFSPLLSIVISVIESPG